MFTTKDLGFEKDLTMAIPLLNEKVRDGITKFKTELSANPRIQTVSAASFHPGSNGFYQNLKTGSQGNSDLSMIDWMSVDQSFIEAFNLEILRGSNFSNSSASSDQFGYIINESAMAALGWDNPVGMPIEVIYEGPIIGVVSDFHFKTLHEEIQPLAMCVFPGEFKYLYVKLKPEAILGSINYVKNTWDKFFANHPFQYSFLDDDLKNQYVEETKTRLIFNILSIVVIIISCLGIFGISTISTTKRKTEISIRKINGATNFNIVLMIAKEYSFWVCLAAILAFPVAYFSIEYWLKDFAYRITNIWHFIVIAGLLTLVLVLLVITWQTMKAANSNPKEALRYE